MPDVVLGALLPPGLVDAAGVEEHDPGLDEEDVHPVDGVAQVVAHQPVHRVGLRYMRRIINYRSANDPSVISFHNHEEDPYYGLLLVESAFYY